MSQSDFEALKAKLLSQNRLWEDDDFPAAPESLTGDYREKNVLWMRPWVSNFGCVKLSTMIQTTKKLCGLYSLCNC